MSTTVQSILSTGNSGTIVDIECHLSNNLPNIIIVGSASKAVDEARERIRGAFSTSRIMLPRKRITVNLAPADIPKADSSFDLAIALAILMASGQVAASQPAKKQAFIGELGLDGSTRAVRGIIGKLLLGRTKGITTFYIPAANLAQAQLVPGVTLFSVTHLRQLYSHFNDSSPINPLDTGSGKYQAAASKTSKTGVQLSEVVGQFQAKRALEIAAAGGHNVFFSGPPGNGKSMLAKALQSILPPLSQEEMLEVTHLHSLASQDYEQIVVERPFRAPHHSSSHAAVIGGGAQLRPGEISLAHRGVLFFDELPEFARSTLEALRQPLEDRTINLARITSTAKYPANFILVATGNPCPCGYYGSDKACGCLARELQYYQRRLSGPVLDRIDLYSNIHEIDYNKMLTQVSAPESDISARQRVMEARKIQANRYGSGSKLNADMTNTDIKLLAGIEPDAAIVLNTSSGQMNLSARGYMRTLKVARTIADLEQSESINAAHIAEALHYRYKAPQGQIP